MKAKLLTAEQSLLLLRENAAGLVSLTGDQPARRLKHRQQPDEWSPQDVLAHIRACCDVWGGNIGKILAEEHATFKGMNPLTWLKRTDYPEWPFEKALRAFSTQRRALLRDLGQLSPTDWERTASVISYGQLSFERSVRSYVSQLARHERTHVRQIKRALAPRATKR